MATLILVFNNRLNCVHRYIFEFQKRYSGILCSIILIQSIDAFGQTVEQLLMKHGKNIVDQQFLLNRLADCAIDIYVMTCVLSRATRSIQLNLESAQHEQLMTKAWCIEASERCRINNRKLHNPDYLNVYSNFRQISKNICKAQGVASINPINV